MRIAVAIVVVCLSVPAVGLARGKRAKHAKKARPTPTASADSEGRSHLKKANALAAHDNCEAAIEEYTLAFDRLNDPTVLLARADCRQRAGQNAEAVEDYRAYLDESPDVANRADIEAKIAALEARPSKESPPPRESARAKETTAPKEAVTPRETAPPKETATAREAARPKETVPPPPAPDVTDSRTATGQTSGAVAPAAVEVEAKPVEGERQPAASHGRLWLWTALAVVVAGGAAAAGYFYFRPAAATSPGTELGSYRF